MTAADHTGGRGRLAALADRLLGRAPAAAPAPAPSPKAADEEARARRREGYRFETRHRAAPPIRVDVDAAAEDLARLVARVEATWSAYGEADAHWSVLTEERFRSGRIAETREDFYRTGEHSVARLEALLARHGLSLGALGHVTDYGCGVGRVAAAIARRGPAVAAVDISAGHLALAAEHLVEQGLDRVETRRIARLAEIDGLPETDLFFSTIVLQHNPPPVIAEILRRALARVRPGGLACFQVPTYRTGYDYDLARDLAGAPGAMEMHVLPQEAVFAALDHAGFVPLEVMADDLVGNPDFESRVFLARRRAAAAPDPETPEGDTHG
jgi:SAM-dependent methyltransferase